MTAGVNPLSLNLYTYCVNNPIIFVDPSGNVIETVFDVGSAIHSAYQLYKEPSWGNVGYLTWDVLAVFVPIAPASGTVKIIKNSDKIVDNIAGALAKGVEKTGGSILKEASESAFKAANGVDSFVVSNKHLSGAGGNWRKFNTSNPNKVNSIVKQALESPNAQFLPNNQPNSYKIITDMGQSIGTKGETKIQVIIGADGKIWTAYPIK